MVATRRGVRVCSPTKITQEQSSDVPDTPSTRRTRSRSTAKPAESPTQHGALEETSNQPETSQRSPMPSSPTPSLKRCSRASRLHSPEQPCTPVGSVHEADVSDVESCCSMEIPMTRNKGRKQLLSQEEVSEVESCSSAVSASRAVRRSTRKKTIPKSPETAPVEAGDANLGNESCSSVVSESTRVTRSQRKPARARSSAKPPPEDSEISDADSCLSSASALRSTTRRSTRTRRQTGPIPIHLDEASEGSQSPRSRRSLIPSRNAAAAVDYHEPLSCDSDGFDSGPTSSMSTRRRGKARSNALDSEPTDVHSQVGSPVSTHSRGTPSSSRTGSGSSTTRTTRTSAMDCSVILEKMEQENSLNDSRLDGTVIDADCTLLEEEKSLAVETEGVDTPDPTLNEAVQEDKSLTVEKTEAVSAADVTLNEAFRMNEDTGVTVISDDDSPVMSPLISERLQEAVSEAAVTVIHQQEEPCAEDKDKAASEMEVMQEAIPPSEPSVTVTPPGEEITEGAGEKDEALEEEETDAPTLQREEALDKEAVVETGPGEKEKMEVSTLQTDAQQEMEASEVEAIQVTSSQQQSITVETDAEQEAKDVIVQKTKVISLLESSEDEEEEAEEEEKEVYVEEEEEEKAGPSLRPEAAAASVDGLFMIDTRPGQEVDELYYKEKLTEEEEEKAKKEGGVEQDEEFEDEEGDDSDDDMDTEILFSTRNPHLKELSSRIDPGIRMKELGGLYINFDGGKSKPVSSSLQKLKEKKIQDEVMKKSVMGTDFLKKDAVPPYSESKKASKLKHRTEREKSTGDGWFNMKAPELTQELKADLQVLKMRGSMDSKRFYKKNDREGFPKYFQVGTVVDSPVDFYHSRVPMKQRKRTMVEELLNDAEFRQNNKKKYQHIVTERAAQGAGRKNTKKSKFHKK
ncbi:hypothetical protein PBY51_024891 [Eleginops maclovinus]|uniref:Fcf2 pre-rRNA processing C-terminal domain-containing protein n=1 Tax=Eleginops maclovinus TaxID=56733 RepID=A0AAN8AS38_ELEMC|nr:hypothetical protein PBY51_024891 [Eleginops maclovinus]